MKSEFSGDERPQPDDGPAPRGNPLAALLSSIHPIATLGFAYAAMAAILFPHTYFRMFLLYSEKFLVVVPLGVTLILFSAAIARRSPSPISFMWQRAREKRVALMATTLMLLVVISAFTTLKANIPNFVAFYADPLFARLDAALHGGEPWRIAHLVPDWTGFVIDLVYSRLWFGLVLGNLFVAAIIESRQRFLRYCAANILALVLNGTILAILLSSVGPIFYRQFYPGPGFEGLVETIAGNPYISGVSLYADYLLTSYRSQLAVLGTGISAMPSMHVALAVLTAWYLTSYGRIGALFGWGQALLIQFGSVYTGWHYAIDGYLSGLTTTVIWILVSRYYQLPLFPGRDRDQARAAIGSSPESGEA